LLAPLESKLKDVTTLVLCPDRTLQTVPFPALIDLQGRYLIQRMALTLAPSASAWAACRDLDALMPKQKTGSLLMVALSSFEGRSELAVPTPDTRGGMQPLLGVVTEVTALQQIFGPRLKLYRESEATVGRVEAAMPAADLLHFATHAYANGVSPLMSALVLAPGAGSEAGLLYAGDIYGMRLQARLAVLSACDTSQGSATGEGIVGLAWAFLVAGCPTTLATRWPLPDVSGAAWVEAFYRYYEGSGEASKAASYQAACLALLKTKGAAAGKDYSAPRYWAGWALLGDDR